MQYYLSQTILHKTNNKIKSISNAEKQQWNGNNLIELFVLFELIKIVILWKKYFQQDSNLQPN